jgi:hypothetical protein
MLSLRGANLRGGRPNRFAGSEGVRAGLSVIFLDTNNIIPRIFDEFTLLHDEIEDKYKSFFLEKWNVIREESKLDEYFEKIEKEDPARIPKILTRFCTLMKQIPQK